MFGKRLTLAAGAAASLAFTAPAAESKPLRASGTAAVKSVDGPGQLTIAVGRRTLPVRLYSVDVPRPGECGAAETTAALKGFVRRAPRRVSYALAKTKTGLQRDASGRFSAVLAYRASRGRRDLGNDLLRAGWGRDGESAAGVGVPPTLGALPKRTRGASGDGSELPAGRIGLWARCGGRVHLPLAEPAPVSTAATWNVGENGIATSIGPLMLSATLSPSSTLTLGGLEATAPVEYSVWAFGCRASVPSLQLEAWATSSTGSCAQASVLLLRPSGPDRARLSRGGGVGLPVGQTQAGYPLLDLDDPAGWLSGARRSWAWQVAAETGEEDEPVVTGLLTYQAALGPES